MLILPVLLQHLSEIFLPIVKLICRMPTSFLIMWLQLRGFDQSALFTLLFYLANVYYRTQIEEDLGPYTAGMRTNYFKVYSKEF